MYPGRNDPCPCGSGRKYKHCCLTRDEAHEADAADSGQPFRGMSRTILEQVRAVAAEERVWAADAIPLMIGLEQADAPRPVSLLVTAGELVVQSEVHGHLRGDAADVATAIDRAVTAAARDVGVFPERLRVRHEEVAEALAPLLAERQVVVETGDVPELEQVAVGLMEHVSGKAIWPPICNTETWSGWDLPLPLVGHLFAAAAQFYRLAPWRDIVNLQAPTAVLPSGRVWTCCVLGNGREQFGLALYSHAPDLFDEVESDVPFSQTVGRILTVTFNSLADAAPAARRELRLHRWELAGPAAYPSLITVNTPGGGAARADIEDMVALFRALPPFVQQHRSALQRELDDGELPDIDWVEPESGISFSYPGDPAAPYDDPVMEYNQRPQPDLGGLALEQVNRLLQSDWEEPGGAVQLRSDLAVDDVAHSRILGNTRVLLDLAIERGNLGATQAGNLKLDVVAELIDRMRFVDDYGAILRSYGKRITEQDAMRVHRLRVVCGLAGLLRLRSQRFEPTRSARSLVQPARTGELFALLFRTWFRRFNIAYGLRGAWPELQYQLAFTLYRLPSVASDWRTPLDLCDDLILPYALDHYGRDAEFAALDLTIRVLDPLVEFGLLARREKLPPLSWREERFRATPLASSAIRFEL
jgi:hypothetical protein